MRIVINSSRELSFLVSSSTSLHKEREENFIAKLHDYFSASQDYDIFEFLRMLHRSGLREDVVQSIFFYAKARAIFGSFVAGNRIEVMLR